MNQIVEQLSEQYFSDLASENRSDTDDNLTAWLWFTCPADRRDDVRQAIVQKRAKR
jgi:hypothetical protein